MNTSHTFKNNKLIAQAFTHKSVSADHNERLEFLGDTLLNFIISEVLYNRFPLADEGQLSRMRASLVNQNILADIARELNFGNQLQLGAGELKSGGQDKDSLLADSVEAVIAAIYLDSDMQTCKRIVLGWFAEKLNAITLEDQHKDPKSILQEWLQAKRAPLPEYEVVEEMGPDNERTFTVRCRVSKPRQEVFATGRSKKQGEQFAAEQMLQILTKVPS